MATNTDFAASHDSETICTSSAKKKLYQPIPIINLSTQTLRSLLPYRSHQEGIFYNDVGIGFAFQLFLQKPSTLHTIQQILQDILHISNERLCYSLHIHHHHYPQKTEPHQYYLFVSTISTKNPLQILQQERLLLQSQLARYHVQFAELKTIDFLVFLRTLISPNIDCVEGPGLVDIQHKPFHTIIPNPGTLFVLSADYIDIITTNALGHNKKIRLQLNHISLSKTLSIWAPLNDISESLQSDWLLSLPLTSCTAEKTANFVLINPAQFTAENQLNARKHYAYYGLNMQPSLTPLRTFLTSLPFWQTDCSHSMS